MAPPGTPEVCVVIPAYNERESLQPLVEGIVSLLPEARILIVDDASPDKTGELADELAGRFDRLEVLHRPRKAGRGSACLAGFEAALRHRDVAAVVEMDADLSHDPAELPGLLAALSGADAVIGSRYLPQSRVAGRSGLRRALSLLANGYVHLVLGLPYADCTYGLRAYSRMALERVDFSAVRGRGFVVLVSVLFQLHQRGLRVREVPSSFVDRRQGRSNLGLREIVEGLLAVLKLRLFA